MYTPKQKESMYLDWFNNFLSTERFRDHYELNLSQAENIIDEGRKLNHRK